MVVTIFAFYGNRGTQISLLTKIGLEKYWHAIVFDTQFRPHEEWPVLLWEVHFTIGHCTKEA